jgi:hypothetical protein
MADKTLEELEEYLAWGDQSSLTELIILIEVYIMAYKRVVTGGVVVALALLIGWGLMRDPLLLAAALVIGFIAGFVALVLK